MKKKKKSLKGLVNLINVFIRECCVHCLTKYLETLEKKKQQTSYPL